MTRRKLTKAELRALGGTPGLMAHHVETDGRARLERLTSEAETRPRSPFRPGLTGRDEVTKPSEGGQS